MVIITDPNFMKKTTNFGSLGFMVAFHHFLHFAVFFMFLSSGQYLENYESKMIEDLLSVNADESVRLK